MSFSRLSQQIEQLTGMRTDDLGTALIARAVQRRLSSTGLQNEAEYFEHLLKHPLELRSLVDEVVVPETWFFRERWLYPYLCTQVSQRLAAGRSLVRIMSAPCATGEEPYSIAIALHLAGINLKRVVIDAVDISQHNLAEAKGARYGAYSFREPLSAQEERLFSSENSRRSPLPEIRNAVDFQLHNLLEPLPQAALHRYDIMLCRNLLIYMKPSAQTRILENLTNALDASNGILILTPAEAALAAGHALRLCKSTSCCFQAQERQQVTYAPSSSPAGQKTKQAARAQAASSSAVSMLHAAPKPNSLPPSPRALADRGELAAAQAAAEAALAHDACDTEAHYVLALIFDALDQEQRARDEYRRLLYLAPTHLDGLTQLALLEDRHGNAQHALQLRWRIKQILNDTEHL